MTAVINENQSWSFSLVSLHIFEIYGYFIQNKRIQKLNVVNVWPTIVCLHLFSIIYKHTGKSCYVHKERKVCKRPTNRFRVKTFGIRIIFNMNLHEKEEGVDNTNKQINKNNTQKMNMNIFLLTIYVFI